MNCPGCGVPAGRWHTIGCDWEPCPCCGVQAVRCGCPKPPLDDRLVWDGSCYWLDACLEFALFERLVAGSWLPCRPDEPGSQPDVVRLLRHCRWNPDEKQFEQ